MQRDSASPDAPSVLGRRSLLASLGTIALVAGCTGDDDDQPGSDADDPSGDTADDDDTEDEDDGDDTDDVDDTDETADGDLPAPALELSRWLPEEVATADENILVAYEDYGRLQELPPRSVTGPEFSLRERGLWSLSDHFDILGEVQPISLLPEYAGYSPPTHR